MIKTNHRVIKRGESSATLPLVLLLVFVETFIQPLKGKTEVNREMTSVVLEVSNSPLGGGIWVDVKKFSYMTILPHISHKALSLGLELVVHTARSPFPLTL